MKINVNFKGKMTCGFINDMKDLVNFTRELKNLKTFTLRDFFFQAIQWLR